MFILILPMLGIGKVDTIVKWMLELNSVCAPLINICSFVAYIFYKGAFKKVVHAKDSYVFIKNKKIGIMVGAWCIFVTLAAICMQIYSADTFQTLSKVLIPVFLLLLGFIVPLLAKMLNKN